MNAILAFSLLISNGFETDKRVVDKVCVCSTNYAYTTCTIDRNMVKVYDLLRDTPEHIQSPVVKVNIICTKEKPK